MFDVTLRADHWRAAAACLHADPDLFFTGEHNPAQVAAAKAICARCPVRLECLAFARQHAVTYGIWGGTTPGDRDRARRSQQRAARRVNRTSPSRVTAESSF
jgi:WhiB family transcriptional regulator, redox-sensing transcriptional regulator